ncbi:uncharacterized protein F5891DRAFT_1153021 [Suillus fuscotomentosus]|uniref:Uncharacterized protein n=1 Tax=Suillus fuscotomentosus TaxID=1912939 RepID=A0AAD4DTJ0_9AGAM|nr:uncharacterized protein F5891DRAFT_1153021 [Suillus fuscotomentosus]KAG1893678.1 hypothetical protein F5891DRAFT_1153021 [Suillus fuscotomentosus]
MLQTNRPNVCDGHYADITAEIWTDIIDLLHVVEVTRRVEMASPAPLPFYYRAISKLPDNQSAPSEVYYQDSSYAPQIFYKAIFGGVTMCVNRTIGSYDIEDGDSIDIQVDRMRVRKPIIYLYSPSDIDVSVKLALIPEWRLSVIYPIVTTEDHGRRLEWNVRTHQDGSLTEHNSGLNVSYLFWEAETNSQEFLRTPAYKPQPVDTFNPVSNSLDDTDSIVTPVDRVTVYLDNSLKVLGLHTEARTSFITYWLPSFLKHEYVALRFIPQAAFERAASLHISPQPDVVTRVFMLFKGIRKEDLTNWTNARIQAEKDVAWWVDVVGVDPARAGDVTLFRALEWGGMEVLI